MVYQWKHYNYSVPAQNAGEELERIKEKYGGIVPESVVEESRPEGAVLHNCFEWNDAAAAEAYREVQAREIIRNIVVVRTTDKEESKQVTIRAFVPVTVEEEQPKKYITIDEAMGDDEYRLQIVQQALKELIAFKTKYAHLKEFSDLFSVIDKLSA